MHFFLEIFIYETEQNKIMDRRMDGGGGWMEVWVDISYEV